MDTQRPRTRREATGASRAFLHLSEGNELAAERPSIARRAVAVLLSALFLLSVPLLWASAADAGKAVRPASSGPGHDGSGHDDDNSGPGSGDDDDDTSATSGNRSTVGTTNTSFSTRDTNTSRKGHDTRGTTGTDDSTRATSTGTSRSGASTTGTTRGGTTG